MTTSKKSFASILRRLREAAGLSVQQLAESARITRESVRLYEAGSRQPTWAAVDRIAHALDVSTEVFRGESATK